MQRQQSASSCKSYMQVLQAMHKHATHWCVAVAQSSSVSLVLRQATPRTTARLSPIAAHSTPPVPTVSESVAFSVALLPATRCILTLPSVLLGSPAALSTKLMWPLMLPSARNLVKKLRRAAPVVLGSAGRLPAGDGITPCSTAQHDTDGLHIQMFNSWHACGYCTYHAVTPHCITHASIKQ